MVYGRKAFDVHFNFDTLLYILQNWYPMWIHITTRFIYKIPCYAMTVIYCSFTLTTKVSIALFSVDNNCFKCYL